MSHFASFDLIILFFLLGVFASWVKSDLEVPESASKFLSIYLLLSLGLKGGHEVQHAGDLTSVAASVGLGVLSCLLIPIAMFLMFKKKFGAANAAGLAAAYGSVSAVTFVTAQSILQNEQIVFSGYMVAVMALMEIPAILIAVFLYKRNSSDGAASSLGILKYLASTKSVILLAGGFAIGLVINARSWNGISPVVEGLFKGSLAFFLLDLGVVAQKQLKEALRYKLISLGIGFLLPIAFGTVSLVAAKAIGMSRGDAVLLAVLAGSASYIAAPTAIRSSITDANPGLYLALPLALTFPFNLLFGISFYMELSLLL
ncbi:MAG: sodium-dependent bicarbonate transport family permease [Deltaproteobacteria bacterium]|nr:sodium-dependent bicarbonate transport family permease [Deltaproteobacteria bacterium]